MYCDTCKKDKLGKIRYLQRKNRNGYLKAKINPDALWEVVEDGENIVHIVINKKPRKVLVYTESEYLKSDYYKEFKKWRNGEDEDDQSSVPDT